MALGTILNWQDIADAPAAPGVYAWYYAPQITLRDLNHIVHQVTELKTRSDINGAREALRQFLDDNLFQYFREQPFSARLAGALKPRYEGLIEHQPSLSQSLLDRLVDDPSRLKTMKEILEGSAPEFASPIYIGMSENLKVRLLQHKALIERYNEVPKTGNADDEARDQSFAREISRRGIPTTRLFVAIRPISGSLDTYIDIENVLNRIHYPLLGRN